MLRAACAMAVLLAATPPAAAEPLLFVAGSSLRNGEVAELLPLPDRRVVRATDVLVAFLRAGRGEDEVVGWDVETGRLVPSVEAHLGAAALDRIAGDRDWHAYDPDLGVFVPLGAAPAVSTAEGASPAELLEQPGQVLLATRPAADRDGDGVPDARDLCLDVPDPAQRDSDGDGYGNACDPDLTNDGIVNFADLARFRSVFLTAGPDLAADFTGDDVVNFADLAVLRRFFLEPPGPSAVAP